MSSAAAAQNKAFGVDRGIPFPVSDILETQCLLVIGANIAECLPPLTDYLRKAKERGAVIIVVDPRETETGRLADEVLRLRPGTDLALAQALLHVIVREGWGDEGFIQAHTHNFEAVNRSVQDCTPAW